MSNLMIENRISEIDSNIKVFRGGIYWLDCKENHTDSERFSFQGMLYGRRPVVVISSDDYNITRRSNVTVVCMTSKEHYNLPYRINCTVNNIPNQICCDQIFTVSSYFLNSFQGKLDERIMYEVDKKVSQYLNLTFNSINSDRIANIFDNYMEKILEEKKKIEDLKEELRLLNQKFEERSKDLFNSVDIKKNDPENNFQSSFVSTEQSFNLNNNSSEFENQSKSEKRSKRKMRSKEEKMEILKIVDDHMNSKNKVSREAYAEIAKKFDFDSVEQLKSFVYNNRNILRKETK